MPEPDRRLLEIGERAPDFVARGPAGEPARFYAHAGGRPTAMIFSPPASAAGDPAGDPAAGAGSGEPVRQLASALAGRDELALWLVNDRGEAGELTGWADPQGRVRAAYGVPAEQLAAVVLDANLRVVGTVTGEQLVERVTALVNEASVAGPVTELTEQTAPAPVLLLPNALPQQWCERLIKLWHTEGGVDTGVARGAAEVLDDQYKRRRDHTVRDPELIRQLSSVVGRRVMPELRKAFGYRATRFEGFKIACYDAETGGFFRPHRDNLSPQTAHRAFALTLNLNDDYQGGQLRFPEYGNQLYRPGAGAALLFSCSHLHEVREVTAGRRFVLLSFLHGDPPQPAG